MLLSIIIPAHNEEKRIGETLAAYARFYGRGTEIIVVLNACKDNTLAVVKKGQVAFPFIKYVDIAEAIGKGGAVREGFKRAKGDLIGFVDADMATSPQEFEKIIKEAEEADGAIASRYAPGASVKRTGLRKVVSVGLRLSQKLLFNLPYYDTQCGAKIRKEGEEYVLTAGELKGNTIILPEFSVTATENALMTAVLAKGRTVIKLAAAEPHVQDLANFLLKMGAQIEGIGTHTLKINGVKGLKGAEYAVIPDQIEAGTLAVAAAVTRSELTINKIIPEHLEIVILKLKAAGVRIEKSESSLKILKSGGFKPFKIQSLPYPGFPTDLQAPFSVLATQAKGTSLIHDPLYEARLSHIKELAKMGANAVICDPHRVLISGPTPLYGREIESPDLRAGATLIIAGLIAQGVTEISRAEVIERGYERIAERLRKIGAKIKKIDGKD